MKSNDEINMILQNYFNALKALKEAQITNNKKDFTCQIGEWLVAKIYDGKLAASSIQRGWDVDVNGKKIQVKTHAKAVSNKSRQTAVKRNEGIDVDELITVVFTENYQLKEFYVTPWKEALKLIRQNKTGGIIHWDDQKRFKMQIEELPNQDIVNLFRLESI
jgi:hypothetical protein